MNIRCGIDVIRTDRIRRAVDRLGQPFLDRIWTAEEQAYCRTAIHPLSGASCASLAARFAAKEAVAKALGTGIGRGIGWTDIVVYAAPAEPPQVLLSGQAKARYQLLGGSSISISLAHEGGLAIAQCVLLCRGEL